MDELDEKLKRVFTIFKFIIFGLFILLFSVFIDSYNFFINLFYEPDFNEHSENACKITQKGLDTYVKSIKDILKKARKNPDFSGSKIPFVEITLKL